MVSPPSFPFKLHERMEPLNIPSEVCTRTLLLTQQPFLKVAECLQSPEKAPSLAVLPVKNLLYRVVNLKHGKLNQGQSKP